MCTESAESLVNEYIVNEYIWLTAKERFTHDYF